MMAAIQALINFLVKTFQQFWQAIYKFGVDILKWFLHFFNDVCVFFITLWFDFIAWLVALLPSKDILHLPQTGPVPQMFSTVNYYFPVSEGLAMVGLWGAIFGVVGIYKFVKFLRGGG